MAETISLRYTGAAISARQGMDAYDVAEAIDGFTDFLRSITQITYGEEAQPQLTVRGFREGSLGIEFVYDVAGAATTIFSSVGPQSLLDLIKNIFKLLEHLKGQAPKSIKSADRGGVIVENNDGDTILVSNSVVHIVVNGPAGQSAEQFARRPLRGEAEKVQIRVNGKLAASADRTTADSLVPIGSGEELGEFVAEQHLMIQTVVLEGDGQWRFSDGRNNFRAKINDERFLRQVRNGRERFGRGDLLKVRLRSKQERIKGQLRTIHVVEEVLEHQPYQVRQQDLF